MKRPQPRAAKPPFNSIQIDSGFTPRLKMETAAKLFLRRHENWPKGKITEHQSYTLGRSCLCYDLRTQRTSTSKNVWFVRFGLVGNFVQKVFAVL